MSSKKLLAIVMIVLGLKVLIIKNFWARGAFYDFSNPLIHIPLVLFLIIGGILLLF